MKVLFGKKELDYDIYPLNYMQLKAFITKKLNLDADEFYFISNGRHVTSESIISADLHVVLKVPGGKGGFGSMLRAIGAQIEKTTNREACRDLSGRRLRDINEEQRLKKWVADQADREKEAKEKKQKKLEKLLEKPKHTFIDQEYDKQRSLLPEKVEDAVLKGLEASCSTKRKSDNNTSKVVKKKPKLWVDNELDEDISSSESENEEKESESLVKNQSTDSSRSSTEAHNDIGGAREEKNSLGTTQTESDIEPPGKNQSSYFPEIHSTHLETSVPREEKNSIINIAETGSNMPSKSGLPEPS